MTSAELSANRVSAFHRRHHLPRCDVHSKEREGGKGSVTGLSWCMKKRDGARRRSDDGAEGTG